MKYEIIIKTKKLYLGIEILRMLFAFFILFFHCRNKNIYSSSFITILSEIVDVGLTLFFIISFYFSYNSFSSKYINKIRDRFIRLLIPYIIWPIIKYLLKTIFNNNYSKKKLKFLIYQIIIGNGIYIIFWFNFNLIFISLFFTIIIFITNKHMTFLILFGFIIFLISLNIYRQFWNGYTFIVEFSLGKIINTYKLGLIAFFLSSMKIIENEITKKYLLFYIFILLLLAINHINTIKLIPKYLFSILLFLIFASIPFEKLKISTYTFIKQISSYTGGIYYIHALINSLLKYYVSVKFISGNIFMSIIHYFLCYFICFIGYKLSKNNILKYLIFFNSIMYSLL
jgi:hypothetical protein